MTKINSELEVKDINIDLSYFISNKKQKNNSKNNKESQENQENQEEQEKQSNQNENQESQENQNDNQNDNQENQNDNQDESSDENGNDSNDSNESNESNEDENKNDKDTEKEDSKKQSDTESSLNSLKNISKLKNKHNSRLQKNYFDYVRNIANQLAYEKILLGSLPEEIKKEVFEDYKKLSRIVLQRNHNTSQFEFDKKTINKLLNKMYQTINGATEVIFVDDIDSKKDTPNTDEKAIAYVSMTTIEDKGVNEIEKSKDIKVSAKKNYYN